MGNTQSSTTDLDDFVSSVINLCSTTTNNAASYINQDQQIYIKGVDGNITLQNITMNQYATVNVAGTQKAVSNLAGSNDLQQKINQAVQNITQSLELKAGDTTTTTTIQHLCTEVATNIVTTTYNQCLATTYQKQSIEIYDVHGNVTGSMIDMDQSTSSITKCVQNALSNLKAMNDLQQTVEQSSVTWEKNVLSFLGEFASLILVGLLFLFLLMFGGAKTVFNPRVFLPLASLLFVLLTASYAWKGFPYKNISSTGGKEGAAAAFGAAAVVSVIMSVYMFRGTPPKST